MMQRSSPFTTYDEAKEAKKNYAQYDEVYARPNPNKEEGGYVVMYGNRPWWDKPVYGGCPRGR